MTKSRILILATATLISLGGSATWAQTAQAQSQLVPLPYPQLLNNPNEPDLSPQALHPHVIGAPLPYAPRNPSLIPLPAPQLAHPQTGSSM